MAVQSVDFVTSRIQPHSTTLRALDGTLQRAHYQKRELTVVANGQIWYFTLDRNCQIWFDDQPAILRCFHPLDHVRVVFEETEPVYTVKAIYAWEKAVA